MGCSRKNPLHPLDPTTIRCLYCIVTSSGEVLECASINTQTCIKFSSARCRRSRLEIDQRTYKFNIPLQRFYRSITQPVYKVNLLGEQLCCLICIITNFPFSTQQDECHHQYSMDSIHTGHIMILSFIKFVEPIAHVRDRR